ncbi:hypothetical protein [Paraburkholderia sp. J12]|uniref:hypothetical protein n=1 Tax=Paraburkholderia sp. J12 TaxID=2805432 RepID=UPI002ABE7C2E|nr:hypothetical protein [Paraburkholderia sp. J12]
MDRRTFLCETGGALLGAGVGCGGWRMLRQTRSVALAGVVFDPTLAAGQAFARHAARAGIEAWSLADDIGMLWHTQLAQRLDPRARLIAALRPADAFVLTRLAGSRGVRVLLPASFGHAATAAGELSLRPAS